MIGTIELLLGLVLAVAGLALLARKLQIAYPIPLVIGGLLLGFFPGLPVLRLDPDLVFILFLPPLLYTAAFFTPWRDFHANIAPILRLAIGLVLFSTVAVAWFAHQFMGFPLAAAFVLGAINSPPDAVAATAITQGLRVPRWIVTVLDGESLVNDAASLTTYRFAVVATVTGAFSLAEASVRFVIAVTGGIIVGLLMGWLASSVQRRLDDPPVQTTLSLLTPYITYLAAERIHFSGVLAVVIAGLYVGWRAPEVLTARMRLVAYAVWSMVVFLLNGFIFILLGLQLPEVVHGISRHSLGGAVWLAVLVVGLLIAVRFLWFFASFYIRRAISRVTRRRSPERSLRHLVLMSWAGMRGVDSLAAALALPLVTRSGAPFPDRAMIVFLTFSVILATLVLQGLTLSPIIRWLRIVDDSSLEEEERQARLKANQAGLAKLAEVAKLRHVEEGLVGRLRAEYEDRIQQLAAPEPGTGPTKLSLYSPEYEKLLREILGVERKTILQLRNERAINDQVLRRIQRDIDLAEARLQQGEAD
ncbi:MAG TPA: Na+/H+ antiporter [Candidatus Baltobacteraceae bacterium]|jgi:CPA1 family monovalent cation:H+ antiporter|nr:Na+/H+ antiporter [Candidatus Baltobacteraceae bacterium]